MQEATIIDYLGENKFVIKLKPEAELNGSPRLDEIKITHDYVMFGGACDFQMERNDKGEYPFKSNGVYNWVKSSASIQIGIREMIDVVLPLLQNSKYLSKEHISDRIHDSDDQYFEKHKLLEPRYKKGDSYPSYAWDAGAVSYNDPDTGINMVKFRRIGESVYETVTLKTYNLIKDNLKLYLTKHDLQQIK